MFRKTNSSSSGDNHAGVLISIRNGKERSCDRHIAVAQIINGIILCTYSVTCELSIAKILYRDWGYYLFAYLSTCE